MSAQKSASTSASAVFQGASGRVRVIIEGVKPQVDGGRFPIKRCVGETVRVEADIFVDGHDAISCDLLYRHGPNDAWQRTPLEPLVNDRWHAAFTVTRLGEYAYTLEAWVDPFETWRRELVKRRKAGQDLALPMLTGALMAENAALRAKGTDAQRLKTWAADLRAADPADDASYQTALEQDIAALMRRFPDAETVGRFDRELRVTVDRERARFSTWYELFPRSCSDDPQRHGTFGDCEARLPYIAQMGFDVLYMPPIHPIGLTERKGRNNSTVSEPGDVGSPWAIGAPDGGHKAIHSELGTLEDFRQFRDAAQKHGIELALDIAFQCSPDHPYVKEHPEWFLKRPDGSIQYAENPPKKYQDIYPFHFESAGWQALWEELKSVFLFWIEEGVKIFRVDNPHTKPFGFWQWAIGEIKREHPEVIFLAEAFTRPKVMHRLAKAGFTQSYTYFTWRNTKRDLTHYFTELTQEEGREYFRPNVWPNTPDILNEYLQYGGRPAFVVRAVLAAMLGATYGMYGPAYELIENTPREPGSEEYLDSEKYQIRAWNLSRSDSLRDLIARLNRIRREHPALQRDWGLRFHDIDNEQIIAFSKMADDVDDAVLVVVNLDPFHPQAGQLRLPLEEFRLDPEQPYQMHDLLSGARYIWQGPSNYVALDPQGVAAHVFRLRRRVRTEHDFDYFM
ncbi:MAG: alpha-1,4-glucan--maltose-1-phosphate maltosyltransferase [Rhodocyclaceae bacterium]